MTDTDKNLLFEEAIEKMIKIIINNPKLSALIEEAIENKLLLGDLFNIENFIDEGLEKYFKENKE